MKVISRPVRVYRLEVDELELGALERACEARIREMQSRPDEDLSRSMPGLLLAEIRAARVGEGE